MLAVKSTVFLTVQSTSPNRNMPISRSMPVATYVLTLPIVLVALRCSIGLRKICFHCSLANASQVLSGLQDRTVGCHGCFSIGFEFTHRQTLPVVFVSRGHSQEQCHGHGTHHNRRRYVAWLFETLCRWTTLQKQQYRLTGSRWSYLCTSTIILPTRSNF